MKLIKELMEAAYKWEKIVKQDVADALHDMKLDFKSGDTDEKPTETQAAINMAVMYREAEDDYGNDELTGKSAAMKKLYPRVHPHLTDYDNKL